MQKKVKTILFEQAFIAAGTFLMALSAAMFLAPGKISTGGVTTVATVLLHLFGIKLSITNLVLNAVLFVLGYRHLGKYAIAKTVSGTLLFTVFLEVVSYFPPYTGNVLVAALSGGVLCGVGLGLVVRVGSSTGGSDFAGLILKKFFPHISIARLILIIDCATIALSGIVFGDFDITFYSLLSMYVSAKITDILVTWGDDAKTVHIFSKKNEEIARCVMERFERGVSGIHCRGMYSGDDGLMLLCVVRPKELPQLVKTVREYDPDAFVIINDAKEVLGEGFKR